MIDRGNTMQSNTAGKGLTMGRGKGCLEISLQAVASTLRVTGGRDIAFRRAKLTMHNTGPMDVDGFAPHATLCQERGLVHDATEALCRNMTAQAMPAGGTVEWDVYDLLLAAHGGVASKVHLWGYKAILDWWFELSAWAEYRHPGAAPVQTPVSSWKLRWSPAKPPTEEISLSIEVVKG